MQTQQATTVCPWYLTLLFRLVVRAVVFRSSLGGSQLSTKLNRPCTALKAESNSFAAQSGGGLRPLAHSL